MVKYSPKENSYREMYLINKFEKDIMENSLQNLRNNKKDLIDKSVATNNVNPEGRKETLGNHGKKILQSLPSSTTQEHNEINFVNNPEVSNLSTENEMPQNSTQINDGSTLEKRVDPSQSTNDLSLSPSSFKRILDTEKRTIKKIKKISKNEKKLNASKSAKLSDKRITRKAAKNTNNIADNKAKKRIVIKNSDKAVLITPFKKKKKENANKSSEEFFHGWKL